MCCTASRPAAAEFQSRRAAPAVPDDAAASGTGREGPARIAGRPSPFHGCTHPRVGGRPDQVPACRRAGWLAGWLADSFQDKCAHTTSGSGALRPSLSGTQWDAHCRATALEPSSAGAARSSSAVVVGKPNRVVRGCGLSWASAHAPSISELACRQLSPPQVISIFQGSPDSEWVSSEVA